MLSPTLRSLTFILFILYAILGIILFFNPTWAATNFAWKISPFVAMTIGGWCLGNAFFALKIFQNWKWPIVYTSLAYLWAFGIYELIVILIFRQRLIFSTPLSLLYITTLILNDFYSILGIIKLVKHHQKISPEGLPITHWIRTASVILTMFVGFLALGALTSPSKNSITDGQFFPEVLSLFTLRAFGAFYLSLFSAGITVIRIRGFAPLAMFLKGGLALSVPITLAPFFHFQLKAITEKPGMIFYILAYVVIFFAVPALLLFYRQKK